MAQLPPQDGANSFSQKVCLFLACSDLIGKDFNSKSDPFVAVYLKDNKSKDFKYVDRTETIDDNHYPKFNKELTFDYSFEKEQILRFDVYDDDNKKEPLNFAKHDFIGSCTMSLGEIVHAQGLTLTKKLLKRGKELKNKKSKMYARLTCTLEIINPNLKDEMITFQFKASNLPKMDGLFGKSDPFFEIIRINPSNNLKIVVYKSETIMNNLNPQWKDFNIALSKLCNFDESMKLTIIVYDYDGKGNTAEEIGQATATFKDLKECPELFLTRPHKAKDVNKTFGKLKIAKCSARSLNKDEIQSNYTFLDYLQGGTEISMMLAIDFTGSNLDPSLQKSLHYIDRQYGAPSKYQQAIRSLGNILSNYDSDQKFPCWTFGIWFRPGPNEQNVAKMDYPLNGNYQNNEVNGIYSIETHYLNLINQIASQSHLQPNAKTIALSGPTNISPILNKAKNFASQAHARNKQGNNAQYYVLLILTDGAITDMKETKDAIIDMANKGLPISIIIVGITFDNNNQNVFEAMEELDADKGPLLNSFGQKAQRDIVQFVEFNKYANNPHQLAAKTLEEIPKQFMDYMNLNKLKPGAKTQIPKNYEQQFALDDNIINRDDTVMIDYQNVKQDKNGIVNNKQYDDMPLPQGWERAYDENGNTYYVDHNTHTTHWDPPIIGIAKNNQKQEEKQQDQKQQQQPQQQQQQLQQQPQQQLQQQPQQLQQQLQQQPQQQQQYQQPQQQQYQQQWAPQQQQQWIPQQQQQWAPQQQWGQQQPQQQWGQQQWAPQQQWGQQQPQQQWAQQQPQQQQWVQQQQGGQQQGGQQQGGQQQGGQH